MLWRFNTMTDSALVIGGGVAGIQASIDLANMGFQIYVVERSPSIGGRMAQLDKTFPTNDCAMCILAPKMIECYRHQNIKLLSYSEVAEVSGELGNFEVKVLRKPSYVDETKCTGCGECAQVCPVELKSEFDQGMGNRKAIYKPFAQAIPNVYVIDKKGTAPCKVACPVGLDVQGYVALISQGKFKEAFHLIRQKVVLPATVGRVCTHPCERECNRGKMDEPIAIAALKRFVADHELATSGEEIVPAPRTQHARVAVIGSGPAGLTAANDLVLMGYGVTIFEALPVPGGMLAVGIPDYRLPKEVLRREIEDIQRLGVEIKLNSAVGKKGLTLDKLRKEGYKAIFIAIGAHRSAKLDIPGEDSEGVHHGVSFLRDVNLGKKVTLGRKIAVVGGGNVAIDAARTALRLGSREVTIVYRRSRQEMPANDEEIAEAEHEGVKIQYLVNPARILGQDGRVSGMECIRMELGEPDASGRRRPIAIEGSQFTIDVDMVVLALGQSPDLALLSKDSGFQVSPRGTLVVDTKSLATSVPGVFAGGDAVLGPATVVQAMAAGHRAAIGIDSYLRGDTIPPEQEPLPTVSIEDVDLRGKERENRVAMPTVTPDERLADFREVNLGFSKEMAVEEAKRCLNCGGCSGCRECEKVCQAKAINHEMKEEFLTLNVGAVILASGFDFYDVSRLGEYGYGKIANVITAIEYERLTSASGPTCGELKRPSDGKIPSNIAFIQCVGSRDFKNLPYCSSVCCMHATKEAILAYEHRPGTKSSIFYMDLRAVGKRFQEYVARAKEDYNVTYIRGRPGMIDVNTANGNPIIWYEDTTAGETKTFEAEMVILSQALVPSTGIEKLASILGINLDKYGFPEIPDKLFYPLDTTRPGIFVCGYAHSPRDIPDSVVQGSAAAARAAEATAARVSSLVEGGVRHG
jgi:homotetrameric NADPH-dependent glutamate synthase